MQKSPEAAALEQAFFSGRPEARVLWEHVVAAADAWGHLEVVATKSRVALLARTRFLWCPQARRDGAIYVRFLLPYRIDDARVRADPVGGRWSLRVLLRSPEDLDEEVLAWLQAAYRADTDPAP